jgi:hypothetical protein
MKQESKFVRSIIQQVNPLELPDDDGNGKVFRSKQEMYLYVMDRCRGIAKNKYIDLFIIIGELYNWNFAKVTKVYALYFKKQFEKKRYLLIDLGDSECKMFYRKLLICLHLSTGTEFDYTPFESAFLVYINRVNPNKT